MSGPDNSSGEERPERSTEETRRSGTKPPPGHFLSDELASDTARFLDEVKRRVRRSKETLGDRAADPRRQRER